MTNTNTQKSSLSRRAFTTGSATLALSTSIGCSKRTASGRKTSRKDADVIIAGAGLSGLYAAMILKTKGYRVITLEASQRIGGRLFTLDDVAGGPEAGGVEIGHSYKRLINIAKAVGVGIDFEGSGRSPRVLAFGNNIMTPDEWENSNYNPFPDQLKSASPDRILFSALGRENPFTDSGAWKNASGDADLSALTLLQKKGFSNEATELINIALNANQLETYSVANLWRSIQLFTQDSARGPSGAIVGGSQRLPEAMAATLGTDIKKNTCVKAVASTNKGVAVKTQDQTLHADFCILALPFPAIANIALDPAPQGIKANAINTLPYTQIMQLHMEPEFPFWEKDGYAPSMWTDSQLERIFVTKDKSNKVIGLKIWINGEAARILAAQPDAMLEKLAQQELTRIRPASEGKIRLLKTIRWTDKSYAGGAYMHWAPGQISKWANTMGDPLGRIHFAGEHLSHHHTGMEGALESGENTANAIMNISI